MRIRCATLNLQGLEHEWFEKRFHVVVNGLRKLRPDIVCLQECTVRYAGAVYNQAAEIGRGIGLKAVAFSPYGNPIEVMSPNQGGIAVISRWPILGVRHRPLPIGHDRPPDARVALLVTLDSPHGAIDVVTTHLSWMPAESPLRIAQLGMVLDEFSAADWVSPTARAVLMGDLNATEDEPAIELVCERLQDSYRSLHPDEPGYTWMRSNPMNRGWKNMPNRRLDYIFCPKDVKVRRAEVILNDPAPVFASDHFGLFAELEWMESRRARKSKRGTSLRK
jgi:endonuclease/exonuclease/phosphatase family metal-dependent hydrolase